MATKTAKRGRVKEIPIKPSKSARRSARDPHPHISHNPWTSSPPFVVNQRGQLTHRVRHVDAIEWDGRVSHMHAEYICGNGCNFDVSQIEETLVSDPPADRLLCQACETKAAIQELPSADHLAGRHVHRGVLVPRRVCCGGEG